MTAGPAEVIAAFDRAAAELGRRYLVTVPAPARLPATVAVRIGTAGGSLAGEAAVALPPVAAGPGPDLLVLAGVGGAVAAVLVALLLVVLRRRSRRSRTGAAAPPSARATPRWATGSGTSRLASTARSTATAWSPSWGRRCATAGRCGCARTPTAAGLGITTVMAEFAHRHRDRYDVAWWIPALDPDLVPDRMAELAEALGLAGPADSADRAAAALVEALRRRRPLAADLRRRGRPAPAGRLPAGRTRRRPDLLVRTRDGTTSPAP